MGKIIKITLSLLIICAVTSGLVAAVYGLTYDAIMESTARAKQEAVESIFSGSDNVVDRTSELTYKPNNTNSVFQVEAQGEVIGYAVDIVTAGFGGDINLMVGFDTELNVAGVSVISQNETPGLGANIKNQSFLDTFVNIKGGEVVINSNVDALTGATISSKAVASGINDAATVVSGLVALK